MPDELKTAGQLVETAPDSALHILRQMPPYKYKSGENRALYGLLMVQALNSKYLPLKPDSLLDFSIAYYQEHPQKDYLATCYLYKGRTYKDDFQYERAIEFYLKALDEAKSSDNYNLKGKINYDLGEIYSVQSDYALARQKFSIAYSWLSKGNSKASAFYSLLHIGRTFHSAKEYKRAQLYYQKILHRANDSIQKGILLQEIGLNFYAAQMPDSALVYLREVVNYPYKANNRAIRYSLLADLYFDLDQIDSSNYYAVNALKYETDIRTKKVCYRILVNVASTKGNIPDLKKYMVSYQQCSDSIRRIDSQTKASVLETIHTTKQEVAQSKQKNWLLTIGMLLILVLSSVFYVRLQKRKDKELVENDIKHKVQKETYHKDVMLKHRMLLLQKIEATKAEQSDLRKKLTATQKATLDRELYNDLLHFNDPAFFFSQMDAVLNNLVTKLKERYPKTSDRQISWCCLFLLNIPSTDILLLLNYKVEGYDKMKQRLAGKFGLQQANELSAFLHSFLTED